ncbi:MAG TPA: GTPase, partial [Anaerolineales bacterium]
MEENQTSSSYKAGFVAVMGRPNVGKSTLINALLKQKVAAVSPRPQTTRKRQMGILTLENAQVIFIDTPGVHKARHKLGENMNQEAASTLQESDQPGGKPLARQHQEDISQHGEQQPNRKPGELASDATHQA